MAEVGILHRQHLSGSSLDFWSDGSARRRQVLLHERRRVSPPVPVMPRALADPRRFAPGWLGQRDLTASHKPQFMRIHFLLAIRVAGGMMGLCCER
jgi:hypothetical protein